MRFFFHEKAFREYLTAADWYEEREEDLRSAFITEVERAVGKIVSDPGRFAFVRKNYHVARVDRFPYSIFFEFDQPSSTVLIHAIYHQKRKPGIWLNRKFDTENLP